MSGYNFSHLIRIVMDNIFSSSVLPLRFVSLLGLSSAAASIALALYYLTLYLGGGIGVPGFVTTVILVIFFGGMTLFSTGLVGEYLLRIVDEVRGPPKYIVREEVSRVAGRQALLIGSDLNTGIDCAHSRGGGLNLRLAEIRGCMKNLSLEVGQIDGVPIDQSDDADPRSGEVVGGRGTQPAGAHKQNGAGKELFLTFNAHLWQRDISRITLTLFFC